MKNINNHTVSTEKQYEKICIRTNKKLKIFNIASPIVSTAVIGSTFTIGFMEPYVLGLAVVSVVVPVVLSDIKTGMLKKDVDVNYNLNEIENLLINNGIDVDNEYVSEYSIKQIANILLDSQNNFDIKKKSNTVKILIPKNLTSNANFGFLYDFDIIVNKSTRSKLNFEVCLTPKSLSSLVHNDDFRLKSSLFLLEQKYRAEILNKRNNSSDMLKIEKSFISFLKVLNSYVALPKPTANETATILNYIQNQQTVFNKKPKPVVTIQEPEHNRLSYGTTKDFTPENRAIESFDLI